MDNLAFVSVNVTFIAISVFANVFFAFCLLCPQRGREGLKQPMKTLLESLVCCTIVFLVSVIAMKYFLFTEHLKLRLAASMLVEYTFPTSMTTSVWLNFFYYTQIVPARRALFTRVKRNIKIIIYWVLFINRVLFLFDISLHIPAIVDLLNSASGNANGTYTSMNSTASASPSALFYTEMTRLVLKILYIFFGLCVVVGSSCATVRYLHRHMKSMKESGSPFSAPRLRSQMRATITGILQGILYVICFLWLIFYVFKDFFFITFDNNRNIFYTVLSLYTFGTTVNLGIGQSVFRQRAADIWLKAQQTWLKLFKIQ
uniref:Taste receptor type 2 n=1 Tax=Oncorhynchus tshawytscha TaxID=74940 RepID=A0A8C8MNL8_ONCTS